MYKCVEACPFCGEEPEVYKTGYGWEVACENEYCICMPDTLNRYSTKEDAIKAWNDSILNSLFRKL